MKFLIEYLGKSDYMSFIFNILTAIGANPYNKSWLYSAVTILHFTLFVLGFLFAELYYLIVHPDGFIETVKTFGTSCYHVVALTRIFHGFFNMKTYHSFSQRLHRKSFEFETCGFDALWTSEVERIQMHSKLRSIMSQNAKMTNLKCYALTLLVSGGSVISIVTTFGYVGFGSMDTYVDEATGNVEVVSKVPYRYYHFLNISNPVLYRLDIAYSSYSLIALTFHFLYFLFQAILIYMAGQVNALEKVIRMIRIPPNMQTDQNVATAVKKIFKKCLDEVQITININEDFKEFMMLPLFFHYQFATFVMCSLIFFLPAVRLSCEVKGDILLIQETNKIKFLGYSIFAFFSICHPLICCWNGQLLRDNFSKLADAVYDIQYWEDSTKDFKVAMMFAMRRLQKPIIISIGDFSALDLTYFIAFLQRTMSIYTLLTNTSEKR